MSFTSVIQAYDKIAHLSLEGRLLGLPGLFTGQHHFELHERNCGTTFEQSEDFSGLLAMVIHWVGSGMYRNTESKKKGGGYISHRSCARRERVETRAMGK